MVLIQRGKIEIEKFHPDPLLPRTQAVTTNRSNFNRTALGVRHEFRVGACSQFVEVGAVALLFRGNALLYDQKALYLG